jgi:hypothetical protein
MSSSDSVSHLEHFKDTFRTPKLKPFATSFDLLMSPSGQGDASSKAAFWAPDTRPGQFKNIYPTLTIDDLPPDVPPSPIKSGYDKADAGTTSAATNPSKDSLLGVTASTMATASEPFVFGSPLPQHSVSNTQFRVAATSVLEEMNKRLIDSGVEGVGMDLIGKLQPGGHKQTDSRELKPLPSRLSAMGAEGEITKKFDDIHKAEFDKMEGIDKAVRRRGTRISGENKVSGNDTLQIVAGKKRKSNVLGELGDGDGMPRRPTAKPASDLGSIGGGRTSGSTRVISNGRRAKALPGAFGDEETPEPGGLTEEGDGRGGKKARVDSNAIANGDVTTSGNAKEKGKVKSEDENVMDVDNEDHEVEGEEQRKKSRQLDREREAIKRKLEMSRAKRRSSVGGAVAAATRSATVAAARTPRASTTRPPASEYYA